MGLESFKYIICDNKKRPQHSFQVTHTYDEVKDKDNLAIKLEEPYLIVDVDDEEQFEILFQIVKDLDIKTRVLKTSRGGHFWFKSAKPLKNVIHSGTPLTINIDIKSWGKQTMEVVKLNGEWREWLQYDESVDVLPVFLTPITTQKYLMHYKEGDGRDDALFTFIIPLINAQLSKTEIHETFKLINKYIFDEPLRDDEISKMFDDNKIFEKNSNIFYKGPKFMHNVFADYLIKEYHIKGYGGDVYFYYNNRYTNDKDTLASKMLEIIPELKLANIKETYENIRLKMATKNDTPDLNFINLKNGLYNIKTHEFCNHTYEIFTVNQLNCEYDESAFDEDVYETIESLACGNEDIITLLIQMLGYFLIGDCRYQKSFILLGNGRNGKSMFLEMIRNWLGDDNCSSLALEDLSERFRTAELVGKMVNIGDDSGHNLLQNTAIFKKLVTGDSITVERKNQNPFKYCNKAKLIFAANALPPTTDKSEGFFRRCIIIPFNAVYRETDQNYDANKLDKLITPNAKNYLFLLALEGLKSIVKNNKFDEPNATKVINDYYELSNNNVLMWFNSSEKNFEDIKSAFTNYLLYCTNSGYKPVAIGKFRQEYEKLKKTT